MGDENLKLDPADASVSAARTAEENLYNQYGLQARERYVAIPGQDLRMRISEFGSGKPVLVVPGNTGDVFPLAGTKNRQY